MATLKGHRGKAGRKDSGLSQVFCDRPQGLDPIRGTVVAVSGAMIWLRQAGISQAKLHSGSTDRTPGTIVQAKPDPQSFLSYGVPDSVAVLVSSSTIYLPFEDDAQKNMGLFASLEELRLSGFIWPETKKILSGKGFCSLKTTERKIFLIGNERLYCRPFLERSKTTSASLIKFTISSMD